MRFATLLFYAGASLFLGIIALPWASAAGRLFGFEDGLVALTGGLTLALPILFYALALVSVIRPPADGS